MVPHIPSVSNEIQCFSYTPIDIIEYKRFEKFAVFEVFAIFLVHLTDKTKIKTKSLTTTPTIATTTNWQSSGRSHLRLHGNDKTARCLLSGDRCFVSLFLLGNLDLRMGVISLGVLDLLLNLQLKRLRGRGSERPESMIGLFAGRGVLVVLRLMRIIE